MIYFRKRLLGAAICVSSLQACGGDPFGSPPSADAGEDGLSAAGSGGSSGPDASEGGTGGSAGSSGEADGGSSGSGAGGSSGGDGGTAGSGGSGEDSGSSGSGGSSGECQTNEDCKDQNACNGEATCRAGQCKAGQPLKDGSVCEHGTDAHFCQGGACVPSVCGDGVVDPSTDEQCDDGNDSDDDGCTKACAHTCDADADCSDAEFCSGTETCVSHACQAGVKRDEGVACTSDSPGSHVCDGAGACVLSVCGDGVVDSTNQEQCEDPLGQNGDDADGCTDQCQFTCELDSDCSDADVCTGLETCTSSHVCKPGTPPNCNDNQVCTADTCHRADECQHTLRDEDGDGFADERHGACTLDGVDVGGDCDDDNRAVSPGLKDGCNAGTPPIDDDCDGTTDEDPTWTWYADCDGDGFAAKGAESVLACDDPPQIPSACTTASWSGTEPKDEVGLGNRTTDCHDLGAGAAAYRPLIGFSSAEGPHGWDFDCDKLFEVEYPKTFVSCQGTSQASCASNSGWVSSIPPPCAFDADFVFCEFIGNVCSARAVKQVNACN